MFSIHNLFRKGERKMEIEKAHQHQEENEEKTGVMEPPLVERSKYIEDLDKFIEDAENLINEFCTSVAWDFDKKPVSYCIFESNNSTSIFYADK